MRETLRHKEAFEFYYSEGQARSLQRTCQKFRVSLVSVKKWSVEFSWQNRIEQRDIENSRKLERKTNNLVVDIRANYRKEIESNLKILKATIATAVGKLQSGEMVVDNPHQLQAIMNTYERIVKLDLLLLGEPTAQEEDELTIRVVD